MFLIWSLVFIASLFVLIKGSDWLFDSSQKIGLAMGMSPFWIGATIISIGTTFPELGSNISAVLSGLYDVPIANVIGSNITNILLILGLSAIFSRKLILSKDLIDSELPIMALSTTLFLIVINDGKVTLIESLFLLVSYLIYITFSLIYGEKENISEHKENNKIKIGFNEIAMFVLGICGLTLGARYLINSLAQLSYILHVGTGLIAITALAVGTSIPELFVFVKAAMRNQISISLGNILGSNILNVLFVIGLPGILRENLTVDGLTMSIGVPVMILATVLLIISGISRRIHIQEGLFFLLIYIVFISKLIGLF